MRNVIIALIFALLLYGCVSQAAPETAEKNVTEPAVPEEEPYVEPLENISAEELANHNTVFNCWALYEGKIYDITMYLANHPGGPEGIVPHCGLADGSFKEAFEGQHGTSKVSVLEEEGILMGKLVEG